MGSSIDADEDGGASVCRIMHGRNADGGDFEASRIARSLLCQDAGAETDQGVAQRLIADAADARRRSGQARFGWRLAVWPRALPARERSLLQGNPPDAGKTQMGIDPLDDQRGEMLQFEREAGFDTDDEGGGLEAALTPVPAALRPAQAERFRIGRQPRPDNLVPVEDNIGLAESLPGEDGIDRRADEIGERARPGKSIWTDAAHCHLYRPGGGAGKDLCRMAKGIWQDCDLPLRSGRPILA
jgi:hypothetical protein